MSKNWKTKSLFFSAARLLIMISHILRYSSISVTYMLSTIFAIFFGCILLYDSEESMMDVYYEKEVNRKEKNKWMKILDTLPIFVMIYDKAKQEVKYLNQHFKDTFFRHLYLK
jgi:c-di-AMP phosphodiesterase-like protein